MSSHFLRVSCTLVGAILYGSGTFAEAAKIGSPQFDLFVWGITPENPTHPLLSDELPLASASQADVVNGQVLLRETIGTNSGGSPTLVQAGVSEDGNTFFVIADSPSHYQTANPEYIGGAAEVLLYQSFTKDTENARLTYTYTFADTSIFVDPEHSGLCPLGEGSDCLRAEILSRVAVIQRTDTSSNGEVWARLDGALVTSQPSFPTMAGFTTGDWPWAINNNPLPGSVGVRVSLLHSQIQEVDLSAIAVGEEFTVWYQLYAYAYDRANLHDVAISWRGRNAFAFAKDPLGGDTGVSFDISDLTPTNNPILPVVPEPQTWAMLTSGLGLLIAIGRRRRLLAPG